MAQKKPPAMSAKEFMGWREYMRDEHKFDTAELIDLLGCGKNTIYEWSVHGAPRYIALACRAIAHGLEPWMKEP